MDDMMRSRSLSVALPVLLTAFVACKAAPRHRVTQAAAANTDVRTIDNVDPRPVVQDLPPMLKEEPAPPKPLAQPWATPEPVHLTPDDEKVRASLPFAPAIALDPVDGSKISILATTPTLEYKGHVYYFSSDENKRTFLSNPDQYAKAMFKGL